MRKNMHAIEELFALLDQFGSYPNGVIQIPERLFTLGVYVPGFLAPLSPELQSTWSDVTSLRTLDERGVALVYPSTFSGVLLPAAVVALTHPAYRRLNVTSRRYGNLQGDHVEQALVRDALARVGN
jgi:hypothetical protein